jgi:hypothetical protein
LEAVKWKLYSKDILYKGIIGEQNVLERKKPKKTKVTPEILNNKKRVIC